MPDLRRTPTRITGPDRTKLIAAVAKDYAAGSSIRQIATAQGISFGMVQGLLREAGVTLRSRGGARKAAR